MRLVLAALLTALLLCACATQNPWRQEQELRELLPGAEVALTDIPAPVAAEIVRAVRDCKREYPAAVQWIRGVKSGRAMSDKRVFPSDYYALTTMPMLSPLHTIILNESRLQSLTSVRKQYATDVWAGWALDVPRNSEMYAIVMHELGHVLTANLMLHDDPEFIRLYQEFRKETMAGMQYASSASVNILEFIAEAFMDCAVNGDKAHRWSKRVIAVIDGKLKNTGR